MTASVTRYPEPAALDTSTETQASGREGVDRILDSSDAPCGVRHHSRRPPIAGANPQSRLASSRRRHRIERARLHTGTQPALNVSGLKLCASTQLGDGHREHEYTAIEDLLDVVLGSE